MWVKQRTSENKIMNTKGAPTMHRGVKPREKGLKEWMLGLGLILFPLIKSQL